MEKSKQRLQYVDALKCLAIFLVIRGHSIASMSGRDPSDSRLFVFIYSFHMPLFMLMVGFFSASSLKRSPRVFLSDKFRALILPTIVWVFTFWVFNAMIFRFESYNGRPGLTSYLVSSFWFLKSAFFCYLLYYFCNRLFRGRRQGWWIAGIVTLLLSQVFPIFRVNWMYPCFFFGAVVARYIDFVCRCWKRILCVAAILFAVSYLTLYDGNMLNMGPAIKGRLLSGDFTAMADLAHVQAVMLVTGISAAVALFSLFYGVMRNYSGGALWKYVQRCGRTTLSIYILQNYILEILIGYHLDFNSVDATLLDLLLAPVMSLLIMVACERIARLIEANGWTAWLYMGKKRPRKKEDSMKTA